VFLLVAGDCSKQKVVLQFKLTHDWRAPNINLVQGLAQREASTSSYDFNLKRMNE
jgi:hypothetical protein